MNTFYTNRKNEILLFLIWLIALIIVNPTGEFPINDDWAYSQNVYELAENGKFKFSFWPAMTLVTQTLWGTLFCKVFGFSFFVLRISTLVLAISNVLILNYLVREITTNKLLALLASLTLICNPLFFSLSFTFMTEIHFLFFFLFSIHFYRKFLLTKSTTTYLLALLFSGLTLLIRQTGIIIPISFCVIWLVTNPLQLKKLFIGMLPVGIGIITLFLYKIWRIHLNSVNGNFSSFSDLLHTLLKFDVSYLLERIGNIVLYIGLMLTPLAYVLVLFIKRFTFQKKNILPLILSMLSLVACSFAFELFPNGNIFYNFGLGPKILKDTQWGDNLTPKLNDSVWFLIKLLILISSVLLLAFFALRAISYKSILKNRMKYTPEEQLRGMFILIACGYVIYLILNPVFFDRYVLVLSVIVLLLTIPMLKQESARLILFSAPIFCLVFLLNTVLTSDYFSWNRARWKALDELVINNKIDKGEIDGGFEFNGWHQTGPWMPNPFDKSAKSWYFIQNDTYAITCGNVPGYRKVKGFSYHQFLPIRHDSIYILKKLDASKVNYEDYPILCNFEKTEDGTRLIKTSIDHEFIVNNGTLSRIKSKTGKQSILLNSMKEYGPKSYLRGLKPGEKIEIKVWRNSNQLGLLILSSLNSNKLYLSSGNKTSSLNSKGWECLKLKFIVPDDFDDDLVFYFWNPAKEDVFFDDLSVNRVKSEE